MTVREHKIRARQFEFEEMSRKLQDLNDLKQHIEMSLDRIASGQGGGYGSNGSYDERRKTLMESLEDINRQVDETEEAMESARALLEESENVRDSYNRVPVAVGKGRGRGQVEHIRIVRSQRG
jgi:chromosome segregation ATPase